MIKIQRRAIFLINAILLSLLAGIIPIDNCIASGDTIYVDDSGGKNYTSIQPAIDAANSGDTIYIYSGTYNENIIISKNLILTGQNKDTTIIDGGKNGHVIRGYYGTPNNYIEISISGFTIRNAGLTGNDCIAFSYVNNGNINDNKILNSDQSDGIQIDHCSGITINGNQITNNAGAGISLTRSENNVIYNNVIQNNQKGLYIYELSSSNNIYSNTLTGNSQYGIHIQTSYYQSQNNIFYQNDFTDNGQNAKDPYSNFWSHNSQGNYWDDYNDYDTDENGIGDSPYDIPSGSNQDEYPLGYFLESEPTGGGNQAPIAYQPTIYPNPASYGNSASFTGSGSDTDGYIDCYNWVSSIDGQLSTSSEFSSSVLSIGTHTIYFKVKDNKGAWSTEKTTSLIINQADEQDPENPINPSENQEPVAFIDSISPNPANTGAEISFSGHGTDEDGAITEWKWTSNLDGDISSESSFNTSGLTEGRHTIYFKVRDNASEWSKQVTETLIIGENIQNSHPIADAGGPYFGNVNEPINFDGSESYDEDGEIIEYLWDFGDDSTGEGESISHTYTSSGNYTITLTVADNEEDSSTNTTTITIVQSSEQNSGSTDAAGFSLEIPFPVIIVAEAAFIIIGISMFIFWMKRK